MRCGWCCRVVVLTWLCCDVIWSTIKTNIPTHPLGRARQGTLDQGIAKHPPTLVLSWPRTSCSQPQRGHPRASLPFNDSVVLEEIISHCLAQPCWLLRRGGASTHGLCGHHIEMVSSCQCLDAKVSDVSILDGVADQSLHGHPLGEIARDPRSTTFLFPRRQA